MKNEILYSDDAKYKLCSKHDCKSDSPVRCCKHADLFRVTVNISVQTVNIVFWHLDYNQHHNSRYNSYCWHQVQGHQLLIHWKESNGCVFSGSVDCCCLPLKHCICKKFLQQTCHGDVSGDIWSVHRLILCSDELLITDLSRLSAEIDCMCWCCWYWALLSDNHHPGSFSWGGNNFTKNKICTYHWTFQILTL